MSRDYAAQGIEAGIKNIRQSQGALDKELLAIEAWLDGLCRDMDAVNARLRELKIQKPVVREEPKTIIPDLGGDFKAQMEMLLQGSLEHLESSLSQKILNMLKDLKTTSGPARDEKLKELKAAVDSEVVDLSKLFINEKLESNITEVGIDEKESKGIAKSIERLRKMREGDAKKGGPDTKASEGK